MDTTYQTSPNGTTTSTNRTDRASNRGIYWSVAIAILIVLGVAYAMRAQQPNANTSNYSGSTVATPQTVNGNNTTAARMGATDETTGAAAGAARATDTTTTTTTPGNSSSPSAAGTDNSNTDTATSTR